MSKFQDLFDLFFEGQKQIRSSSQITLGKLIDKLNKLKTVLNDDTEVWYSFVNNPQDLIMLSSEVKSYRGYYEDLAIAPNILEGKETVKLKELKESLENVLHQTLEGYKGGEFYMDENTPLHIAYWGLTGYPIINFYTEKDKLVLVVNDIL